MAKCVECGYLAIRDEHGKGAFETPKLARTKGVFKNSKNLTENADIYCYVQSQAFPVLGPMPQRDVHKPFDIHPVVKAVNEEHDCQKLRIWSPGKSPKEHEEMSHLEEVKSLYVQEEKRAAKWRKEDRSLALTNLVATAGVALLTTVVTLIAAKLVPWFR